LRREEATTFCNFAGYRLTSLFNKLPPFDWKLGWPIPTAMVLFSQLASFKKTVTNLLSIGSVWNDACTSIYEFLPSKVEHKWKKDPQ